MNILKYIGAAIVGVALFSCDKNDAVKELGEVGTSVPEVYMEVLEPTYKYSKKEPILVPILYWIESKEFGEFTMYHSTDSIAEVKLGNIAGIGYKYVNTFQGELMEYEVYKKESHKASNWDNAKYSYEFNSKYLINKNYQKVVFGSSNYNGISVVTADDYVTEFLNDEFYTTFYKDLANEMKKAQLETVLVKYTNPALTQEKFNEAFNDDDSFVVTVDADGNKEFVGEQTIIDALASMDKKYIVGDKFKSTNKTQVSLYYTIESVEGKLGESLKRNFIVK